MRRSIGLERRGLLAGGLGLALAPGLALAAPGRLAFQVFRNGSRLGEHLTVFSGGEDARTVATDIALTVKVGPVSVYRYRHHAVERWDGGEWVSLESSTNGNGKVFRASGRAMGTHVQIEGPRGAVRGPADAVPLSHWNPSAFGRPLFNPQEGKMLKVRCSQVAPGHWAIRGEAEIDDFYDTAGNWLALKGRLEDGSLIEYRRI